MSVQLCYNAVFGTITSLTRHHNVSPYPPITSTQLYPYVPTFVFAYWGKLGGEKSGEGASVPSAPCPDDYRVWGSVVSSPSGVRGEAPAADELSKFWIFQNASAET